MFGTSGVRGPVGETVTAELALHVGRALAVGDDVARVVVGRDARGSGSMLADAVSVGLRESGVDVVRLGVVSTPTVARSVGWRGADAGVAVTASHNPPADNGLKLWTERGRAFDDEAADAVARRIRDREFDLGDWRGLGAERTWDGAADHHVETLVDDFDSSSLSDLHVVVDLGNGTGRVTVDALYGLDASVDTLNAQPDGRFPARPSEPTPEHLTRLADTVAATDADLGVAHDGDADRMVAVTETGECLSGDVLLAVFAHDAVTAGATVAVPVDTSRLVADVVDAAGGDVVYTPVGDTYVAAAVSRPGFVFGGEPSGAWIWPDATLCPDGPYAACRLASLVAREGSLSALVDGVVDGRYATRRANVPADDKRGTMARVEDAVLARYDGVDTTDGVRVDVDDGWFLVRASGTEPLIRVTAEARDDETAASLLAEAKATVEESRSA